MADLNGRIRVFCRIRPLSAKEAVLNSDVVVKAKSQFEVEFKDKDKESLLEYDSVFGENEGQI